MKANGMTEKFRLGPTRKKINRCWRIEDNGSAWVLQQKIPGGWLPKASTHTRADLAKWCEELGVFVEQQTLAELPSRYERGAL